MAAINSFVLSFTYFLSSIFLHFIFKFYYYAGVGGVFLVKNGIVLQHIAPNFPDPRKASIYDVDKWAKFFNMNAPLTAVGTFITSDMGLNMQLENYYSFSGRKWGGHYDKDKNANNIEYEAYFNIATRAALIDRPKN